jgi:hypothetical protein
MESAWRKLWVHGSDRCFLKMTGLTRDCFNILTNFLSHIDVVNVRGRRRALDFPSQVGLLLFYLGSQMTQYELCLLCGITESSVSLYINKLMNMICDNLVDHPAAKMKWPNDQDCIRFKRLVMNRCPEAYDVIGFIDGLSLEIQCPSDVHTQELYYNGWHHNHNTCVNNVLFFSPEGKILAANYNHPGSAHDVEVSRMMLNEIVRTLSNYKVCVDKGFPRDYDYYEILVGPLTDKQMAAIPAELRPLMLKRSDLFVSLRQASEWGMKSLQGTFSRMRSRLPWDKTKRLKMLTSIFLLHNFRTHYCGINQIASVFDPCYQKLIRMQNYDRIKRYYNSAFR